MPSFFCARNSPGSQTANLILQGAGKKQTSRDTSGKYPCKGASRTELELLRYGYSSRRSGSTPQDNQSESGNDKPDADDLRLRESSPDYGLDSHELDKEARRPR